MLSFRAKSEAVDCVDVIHLLKTSHNFDFLSMMNHLKEKEILFTMTQKLAFNHNPDLNYESNTTCMCGTSL